MTGPASLAELLPRSAAAAPDRVVVLRRRGAAWQGVTAGQFLEEVHAVARGLVATGVEPGDRVGLMSKTRYEWTLMDLALWAAGAVPVPVYETSSAEQLTWILSDSGAVGCIVESAGHAARLAAVRDSLPQLRFSWQLDGGSELPGIPDLVRAGRSINTAVLADRQAGIRPDSLATIIYTSGTTGRAKGCELSHGNFLAECTSAVEMLPELFGREGASTLLFLPLAHVFGRMIQVACVLNATLFAHSDFGRLTRDLPTMRPTFVLAVPQVFEKVYEVARRKATADGRGRLFALAADTAVAASRARDGRRPGLLLRARHAVFDRLVYGRLRAVFGGRLQWAISGGAPLGARLGHFYRGIGVPVLEGYGLTETTAAATVNNRAGSRIGTVGRALPRFEVATAADGEVLIRGGHVFRSYWQDAAATAGVLDADGWLHTGDLGVLDADGFLTITGRSKEILVTSGGKNVAPAALEDIIRAHPLVAQCLVVGDARPYLAALITLDLEALEARQQAAGKLPPAAGPVGVQDPDLLADLQTAVDAANASVSAAEAVRRFVVLPEPFSEERGHLTPTLKLRRAQILRDHAPVVEALYAPAR